MSLGRSPANLGTGFGKTKHRMSKELHSAFPEQEPELRMDSSQPFAFK